MTRCIALAKNGLGNTYPNPMVGSLIVHKGKIIGEGWHRKAGGPHAEVLAIAAVKNKNLLEKSILYVNLEPCSHYGKTPPCADLIIENKIPKVIIGTIDPFAKIQGRGIERLRHHGVEVTVGALKQKCCELNKRFFTYHQKKRPYIILKWAQTIDGYIDRNRTVHTIEDAHPNRITNAYSKQLVHKWRSEEQAILIGTRTAIHDNPRLDTRHWAGKSPLRMVLDRRLRIPKNYHLFDNSVPTVIFTEKKIRRSQNTTFVYADFSKNIPQQICSYLYQKNVQSLIIEGGSHTLQHFIDENLWDEARVFDGDISFVKGIKSPKIQGIVNKKRRVINDKLTVYTPNL